MRIKKEKGGREEEKKRQTIKGIKNQNISIDKGFFTFNKGFYKCLLIDPDGNEIRGITKNEKGKEKKNLIGLVSVTEIGALMMISFSFSFSLSFLKKGKS